MNRFLLWVGLVKASPFLLIMKIENKYNLGDEVYLKTDPDQYLRIVTGISIRQVGILYELSCAEDTSTHYDFEISRDINMVVKTS
jgi:hypothetical protein